MQILTRRRERRPLAGRAGGFGILPLLDVRGGVQLHHPGIRLLRLLNTPMARPCRLDTTLSDFDGGWSRVAESIIYDTDALRHAADILLVEPSSPACLSYGAAAGACTLQRWRLGDQFGAPADAS